MILENYETFDKSKYPVIIIGSGPAGISLALELEKKNIRSVIIEAGKEVYDDVSQLNFKGHVAGDQLTDISESRLRQFGGTSGTWGGWCKPLSKHDYNKWGFDFKNINDYQDKACKILDIKNSFKEAKLNSSANQIEFQYSSVRFNEKYYEHLKKSKKILLILNTQLSHFIGNNKKITSAICINKKKRVTLHSKKFILCCGGIENSRILLLSQKKNKDLFNQKIPIGKYWMTHYWILAGIGLIDKENLKKFMGQKYLKYDGPIHIASNDLETNNNDTLQNSIYMTFNKDKKIYKEIIKELLCVAPKYGKKIAALIFNKSFKCGNIFMHIEEKPIYENSIILDSNRKDFNKILLSKINYKSSIQAKKDAKLFLEELAILFSSNDLGRLAMTENLHKLKNFENLGNFHHMGGTRMGTKIDDSVVDQNLKVHEIDNLFISGSSIFRTSTYKNPTFSIIQFSLRLADHIKTLI